MLGLGFARRAWTGDTDSPLRLAAYIMITKITEQCNEPWAYEDINVPSILAFDVVTCKRMFLQFASMGKIWPGSKCLFDVMERC